MRRDVVRVGYGLFYVAAGLNHFVNPEFYLAIMPPYLPWHGPLVFLSGAAEVALGALLCIPRTTRLAGWGLIVMLLAIFPANLHMALHAEQFPQLPSIALWLRLPIQAILIAWAYHYARRGAR
ncbi:MAG: DoxX family membrane protein [Cytophagaceae bacterium]|nr:DoxX family membrane protein [Gemmatimonadaceae bacterium]